jgi:hypothetical protein
MCVRVWLCVYAFVSVCVGVCRCKLPAPGITRKLLKLRVQLEAPSRHCSLRLQCHHDRRRHGHCQGRRRPQAPEAMVQAVLQVSKRGSGPGSACGKRRCHWQWSESSAAIKSGLEYNLNRLGAPSGRAGPRAHQTPSPTPRSRGSDSDVTRRG